MIEIIPNWHPIFVHYTVALIPVSTFCYLVGYLFHKQRIGQEWSLVGRWCLWFGALAAIATVSAGFMAYYSVAHDATSHLAMTIHRNWAITTLIAILCSAAYSARLYLKKKSLSWAFLLLMACTTTLVTITAWFGAEVVYRYGIGVQSLPESTGIGHSHTHDEFDSSSEPHHSLHGH